MKSVLTDLEMYQEILGQPGSSNSLDNREQHGLVELCKLLVRTIEKVAPNEIPHYDHIFHKRLHSRETESKYATQPRPQL